jgi:hypothetical protein
MGSPAFKLYAEFGRDRCGLLLTVQAAVLALVTAIMLSPIAARLPAWIAPALVLPAYLMYFLLRERIWQRLYQGQGHLRVAPWRTRADVWRTILLVAWAGCVVYTRYLRGSPQACLIMAAWAAIWFGIAVLSGRVPDDAIIAVWTALLTLDRVSGKLLAEAATRAWWARSTYLIFALYAARGIWEHYRFLSAASELSGDDASTGGKPDDRALR